MEGSVAATPTQGAPVAPVQPAAPAAGQSSQQQATSAGKGDSFNWGLFPDVPEGHRELLQPHLRNVLGHVTKLEQQYSPYKGLTEMVGPDQVQNLTAFLQNYQQNPMATWVGLAQSLVDDGTITNPEFSIEALQAMAQGPPQAQQDLAMGDMPPWAQQMAQQMQMLSQAEEARQAQEQQRQAEQEAMQQEQMLAQAHTEIQGQLKAAGVPEGLVTPEQMTAALIAHQGDIPAVISSFTGLRDGFLKGFTQQNGGGKPPTVNGAAPEAPGAGLRPKSDSFRQASLGAEQMLKQASAFQG